MEFTNFINSRYSLILIAKLAENNLNRSAFWEAFLLSLKDLYGFKLDKYSHTVIHCNLSSVCPLNQYGVRPREKVY